jgi:hypothetical protein
MAANRLSADDPLPGFKALDFWSDEPKWGDALLGGSRGRSCGWGEPVFHDVFARALTERDDRSVVQATRQNRWMSSSLVSHPVFIASVEAVDPPALRRGAWRWHRLEGDAG